MVLTLRYNLRLIRTDIHDGKCPIGTGSHKVFFIFEPEKIGDVVEVLLVCANLSIGLVAWIPELPTKERVVGDHKHQSVDRGIMWGCVMP